MKSRLPQLALALLCVWVLLVLFSWIFTALHPTSPLRSLLSAEGIRWLFGHNVATLTTPVLTWIVLGTMAYGPLKASGLLKLSLPLGIRERFSLRLVAAELLIVIVVMALLTLLPQPVLLSATGNVSHSSFVYSLVPVVCLTLITIGLTYGLSVGSIKGLSEAYNSIVSGFKYGRHFLVFYILITMLYATVGFVFNL